MPELRDGGKEDAMRKRGVRGVVLGVISYREVANFAPAFHFQQTIGLALLGALFDWEATGDGECMHEINWLVDYLGILIFNYFVVRFSGR